MKKVGDKDYEIVAGERRYRAMGYLIQEGIWSSDRKIKVHIFNPNLITLPLTDEEKEDYVRLAEKQDKEIRQMETYCYKCVGINPFTPLCVKKENLLV